uniref:Uncharacterized protein n=1 Tax=Panagrellus redivivus TaxID=6233 RepID=A0A7E4VW64_PANRE
MQISKLNTERAASRFIPPPSLSSGSVPSNDSPNPIPLKMGEIKSSSRQNSRHVERHGANIEKMINELSAKLIALSGEECEVEVDVRLRFPKKQQRSPDSIESEKEKTRSSRRSSRSKKAPKERKVVSTPKRVEEPSPNKMRDFVFDVSSYATTDARDNSQNAVGVVRRRSSPDIITFNGMCNDSDSSISSKSRRGYDFGGSNASSAPSTSGSSYTATPSTSQVFPKADAKYKRSSKL